MRRRLTPMRKFHCACGFVCWGRSTFTRQQKYFCQLTDSPRSLEPSTRTYRELVQESFRELRELTRNDER